MLLKKEKQASSKLEERVVALAGNPNVGKSTIFNYLTGLKQHTGNWPGKTVASATGTYFFNDHLYKLVDIPGTYSLSSNNAEEEIAREFICQGSQLATLVVIDATSLERGACLVLETLLITENVVVCVNLLDEAKAKGIKINFKELSKSLQVPVIGTCARSGKGMDKLMDAIDEATEAALLQRKEECLKLALGEYPKEQKERACGIEVFSQEKLEGIAKKSEKIFGQVVKLNRVDYNSFDRKLDKILTSKLTGIPIMLLLLLGILWLTIVGANYPSQLLSQLFGWLEGQLSAFVLFLQAPIWLHDFLVLGIYKTLAWVVAVMLPPMAIFFPLFSLLEDFGYLPRVAFNLDNTFRRCQAHGKQSLTMCMGFGCNACAIVGCRIINSPRERLIAIITNNFVPCNGRFPPP